MKKVKHSRSYGFKTFNHTPRSKKVFFFNRESCNVDDLTTKAIGEFGRWQLRISVLMALLKLPMAWYQLNILFMAPQQDFWCEKPRELERYSVTEWRRICLPYIEEYPCLIFDPNILAMGQFVDRSLIPLVECKKFVYNQTIFTRTMISDWDLVCSKHWIIHFTQCVMMWGIVLGGIIFGILADKYGRRTPLMVAIVLQSLSSYGVSMIPGYWWWLAFWFVLALCSGGLGIISFVICIESASGKWRTTIAILYQLPFGFGSSILAYLAYLLRDWRKLEFALASLSSIYILYWFWIPESPRWLLATGQTEKALDVLKKAALENHTERDFESTRTLLTPCKDQKRNGPGFSAFFKLKNMRLKTILLSANWFCTGLAFYVFSQYLSMIGDNVFLTVAVSGIVYVPGALVCLLIVAVLGRKSTLWIFQSVTAVCFLLIWITPKDVFLKDWPRLVFAAVGFGSLAGSVPALYLYSAELYPTLGRNAGVGGVTTFARIAAMIAPIIVSLEGFVPDLPMMLLVIVTFGQLFLIVPLPETKGYPLPDTIEAAENFRKI